MKTLTGVTCQICGVSVVLDEGDDGWFTLVDRAAFLAQHAACLHPNDHIDLVGPARPVQVTIPRSRPASG